MRATFFTEWLESLVHRFGEHTIPIALLLSQFVANLGVIPAVYFVQSNAEIDPLRFRQALSFLLITLLIGYGLLFFTVLRLSVYARTRLRALATKGLLSVETSDEAKAWEEITALGWKYAIAAALVMLFINILPLLIYERMVLDLAFEQVVYTGIGAAIAAAGGLVVNVFSLEAFLTPVRKILTPKSFDVQLAHFRGLPLMPRLLTVALTLVAVSVALVAPIGYRQAYKVIYEAVSSIQVLEELQVRSLVVTAAALILGIILAGLVVRSVDVPLRQLIEIFSKVETGDLAQRAPVIGTHEVGQLAIYFNRMIARLQYLQENLESEVARRTAQLKATLQVAQVANSILDPDELMERVVQLITNQFGYYYAAIFLIDESGRWAELKHATGEAGKLLRQRGHRLEIEGKSMVGAAIRTRQARLALDVGEEPVRFDNPLLPYTRSEIALPLMVGGEVLGALDVQSTQEAAFSEADIETLQTMANQVAIALQNARLFQSLQQSLQEMRAIQRQYVHQGWGDFLSTRQIRYEVGEEPSAESPVLKVPLALRQEIIGQIALEGELEWSEEEKEWLETLASQAALALEGARILDESARQAELERMAAQIIHRVRETLETRAILRTAARELQRILRLPEVILHFGPPPQERK